jgi:mono/diheme cytochrome c family protein
MFRNAAFFVAVSAASLIVAAATTGGAQEPEPGERIMNAACQDCHTVRVIQVQAMEIEKGAKVSKDDVPTLVNYLVRTHGPLPNGPGKEIVLNTCTQCHDLFRIKANRRSPEEWEETLISMLNEGAMLNDEEFARVHQYLSRNFGIE